MQITQNYEDEPEPKDEDEFVKFYDIYHKIYIKRIKFFGFIDWLNPKEEDYVGAILPPMNYNDVISNAAETKRNVISMLPKLDLKDRLFLASLIIFYINTINFALNNPYSSEISDDQVGLEYLSRSKASRKEDIKILEDFLQEHLSLEATIVKSEELDKLYRYKELELEQHAPEQEQQPQRWSPCRIM